MDNRKKKLLTIEDLVNFCENKQLTNFSAKESGYQLCVQVPATFKKKEVKVEDNTLLYCILKTCHIGLNRNGSYISEETMKEAMPTLKYKPILCNFTDTEEGKDFTSHDMEIDEDGNIIYIERQVGCFTADEPYLEYDEENDKTYVMAYAAIPRDYTEAADIIERKDGTKVSVELNINEMSYNGKEKYLQLDSFVFAGCTLLGVDPDTKKEVGEGMKGSRLDIADFSVENNSVQFDANEELLNEIKKLNEKLSHFNINQEESKSSEIYGKEEIESMNEEIKVEEEVTEVETVEETAETVEEFTEETVEEVVEETVEETVEEVTETEEFTEEVAEVETDETVEEGTPEVGEEETEEVESEVEVEDETEPVVVTESLKPEKYSVMMSNGTVKEFALTLDEINNALYMLVNDTYGEADDAWYSVQVYEDGTLIMMDWWNNKAFRQSYKREEDNFSLVGDRVAVKQIWVTDEEETSLNEMRSNYASLVQFKEDTENARLHAQREEILYNEKYSVLAEKNENNEYKNEAYAKLVSEMDNYSLTDLEKELKSVFADYITNGGQFSYVGEQEDKTVVNKKLFADSAKNSKKSSRYGNLFNK
jgi:hypothetical protein